ncbi:MAG: hypothetical protein M3Y87_16825 [Myxococcota bacterium]|nr:hypothetical protein [Myxococcota bacterium]
MDADPFDEAEFFRAIAQSGARSLLIGRRALIALGLPVMTQDYDFWTHRDDITLLNDAVKHLELYPTRSAEEARVAGRYVLENGEHVDVLVARQVSTIDGEHVRFDDVWERRETVDVGSGARLALPSIDDLIATKRFAARPKDAEDIRLLRALKESRR